MNRHKIMFSFTCSCTLYWALIFKGNVSYKKPKCTKNILSIFEAHLLNKYKYYELCWEKLYSSFKKSVYFNWVCNVQCCDVSAI